jgi:uncharacterized YccA/Bax inhibitor family protein
MLRTANPALTAKAFTFKDTASSTTMTVAGTINKTGMLLCLLCFTAGLVWHRFFTVGPQSVMPWMVGGVIGGLVLALITVFKKTWAPVTAPAYALFEGAFIGGLSAMMEMRFPGIVLQAVGLTFGVLACMLIVYRTGLIKVTQKFRMGLLAATGAVFLVYMGTFILGLFGVGVPYIHGGGTIGIGFSVVVVIIAALNLVLDFDLIEKGARSGAPKVAEWYGAFALMVTLVWLYIEILRLLAKLNRRR